MALQAPLGAAFDAVGGGWQPSVDAFVGSAAGRALCDFVDARVRAGTIVHPDAPLRALRLTPLHAVRAVVLGQDPYHGPGQAEGLAFSVPPGVPPPPSLRNIFKELQRDLGQPLPAHGSLLRWAERGVLLLNTVLTVEQAAPASHARRGWEPFTQSLIDAVAARPTPTVFFLWGASAQLQADRIAALGGPRHLVLRANHPSPLSALRPPVPFIGCGHFGRARDFLERAGRPVDWAL